MKGRVIALDGGDETRGARAALMVDGRLEDLLIDPPPGDPAPSAGDICVVRINRVLPNGRGAFAAMAGGAEGFLRDAKGASAGVTLLAQVASLPEAGKAVPLSRRVLYKGPRLILTPGAPGVNVSKKIGNSAERARLEAAVTAARDDVFGAEAPGMGVIVRTSARGETEDDLTRELLWLRGEVDGCEGFAKAGEPCDVPLRAAHRVARQEWLFPEPDEIVADAFTARFLAGSDRPEDPGAFFGDRRFLRCIRATTDPFAESGADEAIAGLAAPEVPLEPGTLVIEPTRALVAVDVNTGGDFSPAAGLKMNLAAARALPRQLRLRGLGGQVIVDFAPMPKQQRRTLEEALAKAFRADPVETTLVGWTRMGLYELQRKRERRTLEPGAFQ